MVRCMYIYVCAYVCVTMDFLMVKVFIKINIQLHLSKMYDKSEIHYTLNLINRYLKFCMDNVYEVNNDWRVPKEYTTFIVLLLGLSRLY